MKSAYTGKSKSGDAQRCEEHEYPLALIYSVDLQDAQNSSDVRYSSKEQIARKTHLRWNFVGLAKGPYGICGPPCN